MNNIYTTPTKELQLRWEKIQTSMKKTGAEACFISTNINIYYTLGQIINGYVLLFQEGEPLVFIRRPIGIQQENYFYIRKPEDIIDILKEKNIKLPQHILLENDEISYNEYLRYEKIFQAKEINNASYLLRKVRSVKTDYEVQLLTESARLQTLSYAKIPSLFKTNMTDHELTVEIEKEARLLGNLGVFRIYGQSMEAFMGSVLSGENAGAASPYDFALGGKGMHPSLPMGHDATVLKEGMSIMIDIHGNYTGYISDQTRVFSIGKLPQKAYDAQAVSIEIQNELALMGKPGVSGEELYIKSLEIVKKHRLEDCFMGTSQQAKFVGHGVGLVINELPVLSYKSTDPLKENMCIAIEPKFVIKGVGAVGVENTFVVKKESMKKLTHSPEEIIDLLKK